jgi:hypothetical protein
MMRTPHKMIPAVMELTVPQQQLPPQKQVQKEATLLLLRKEEAIRTRLAVSQALTPSLAVDRAKMASAGQANV